MKTEFPERRVGRPTTPEIDKFQSMAWFNTIAHSLGTNSPSKLEKLIQPKNVTKRTDGKTVPYGAWKEYKKGRLPRDGMMSDGDPGAVVAAGKHVSESLAIYRHKIWDVMRNERITFDDALLLINSFDPFVKRFYFDLEEPTLSRKLDSFVEYFCQPIWISREDDLIRSLDHLAIQLTILRIKRYWQGEHRYYSIVDNITKTLGPISVSAWIGPFHESFFDWIEKHMWNDLFDRYYEHENIGLRGWRKSRWEWIWPSYHF